MIWRATGRDWDELVGYWEALGMTGMTRGEPLERNTRDWDELGGSGMTYGGYWEVLGGNWEALRGTGIT